MDGHAATGILLGKDILSVAWMVNAQPSYKMQVMVAISEMVHESL